MSIEAPGVSYKKIMRRSRKHSAVMQAVPRRAGELFTRPFSLEQGVEPCKGLVGVRRPLFARLGVLSVPLAVCILGVFDIMAVDAQELPVAPVRGLLSWLWSL